MTKRISRTIVHKWNEGIIERKILQRDFRENENEIDERCTI